MNVRDKERTERVAADSLSIVGETSAHGTIAITSFSPTASRYAYRIDQRYRTAV